MVSFFNFTLPHSFRSSDEGTKAILHRWPESALGLGWAHLAQHPIEGVVMNTQLPGNGAHAPLFYGIYTQ
ncbi:MAG: hypothetical protein O7C39_07385, partial [Bacteroidetes bacterium]|nr:hypothetical protein [Bacteroidota bacterium]